jgi:hypothetical protein
MRLHWIDTVALPVVAGGSILVMLALVALGLAALRGRPRAVVRIAAVIAALVALILLAAWVLGSSPSGYSAS